MDFIQHLHTYTKGDLQQGKWMIGIAVLIIFPICILFIKTSNSLQKGMLIPLGLLLLMNVGYALRQFVHYDWCPNLPITIRRQIGHHL